MNNSYARRVSVTVRSYTNCVRGYYALFPLTDSNRLTIPTNDIRYSTVYFLISCHFLQSSTSSFVTKKTFNNYRFLTLLQTTFYNDIVYQCSQNTACNGRFHQTRQIVPLVSLHAEVRLVKTNIASPHSQSISFTLLDCCPFLSSFLFR